MSREMHIVVIMDPPETVIVDEDTSFALMLEAQEQGHRVDHCAAQDLFVADGRLQATVRRARMQRVAGEAIVLSEPEDIDLHEVDAVLVRTDPPFDSNYLWCTHMLDRLTSGEGKRTLVVNSPHGLRQANEKLYACYFPELMPRTLVTAHKQRIKDFVAQVGGRAVIKPLDGAGGEGVLTLAKDDLNLNAIIELQTQNGGRVAMVQEFLPEVSEGDKRILLLDGEPLGGILRVPRKGDVRSNIHVGGSVVKSEITDRDREIIAGVAPRLKQDGLHFVGLDVIGGRLTEVNVTSPTGIQQMSRLNGENLCARVIDWLVEKTA
jgi:glutathione synthase